MWGQIIGLFWLSEQFCLFMHYISPLYPKGSELSKSTIYCYHYCYYCYYCIAGIFGRIKIGQIAIFCGWPILTWQIIGRHRSLTMHTVNENGGFNFGKQWKNYQIRQNNPLQNYPLYGITLSIVLFLSSSWWRYLMPAVINLLSSVIN